MEAKYFPCKNGDMAGSLSPLHGSFPPLLFDVRCPHVLSPGIPAGRWWHGIVGLSLPQTLSRWWDSSRDSPSPCPGEAQPGRLNPDPRRADLALDSISRHSAHFRTPESPFLLYASRERPQKALVPWYPCFEYPKLFQ